MGHQNCCSVWPDINSDFHQKSIQKKYSGVIELISLLDELNCVTKKDKKILGLLRGASNKSFSIHRVFILSLDQCVKFPVIRSQLRFVNKSTGRGNLKFSGVFHWMQTQNQDQLTLMYVLQIYLCTRFWQFQRLENKMMVYVTETPLCDWYVVK